MDNNMKYTQAIEQAKTNLADAKTRGEAAIDGDWEALRAELYTPEEIAASDARVAIMSELIKARNERNISQRELEALSGVSQPVISRMESGAVSSQLDSILKVLGALGKTLYVGDIPKANA